MIRAFLLLATLALGLAALGQTPAIDAARAAGSVGERYDGYLGIASPVSPAVRSQVATVNIRRRALYSDLASRRGVSPQEVGITAGCRLLARVAVGQAYLLANEGWRRRSPGQRAPVPDYCR